MNPRRSAEEQIGGSWRVLRDQPAQPDLPHMCERIRANGARFAPLKTVGRQSQLGVSSFAT